jgi:FdhE protein
VFAERQMRLRQLASGHAMGDFLRFMADLARAQQAALLRFPAVACPTRRADRAPASAGLPPLPAADWPRDPAAWRGELRRMAADLRGTAPEGVRAALDVLDRASDDDLEQQADCLLTGVMKGLDLATRPSSRRHCRSTGRTWCCPRDQRSDGSGPALRPHRRRDRVPVLRQPAHRQHHAQQRRVARASATCTAALCSLQWHMVRIKCPHCLSIKSLAYQSLDAAGARRRRPRARRQGSRAGRDLRRLRHYLKIMHTDRDPFVDPVADDLASVTLDLLVSEPGCSATAST